MALAAILEITKVTDLHQIWHGGAKSVS